MKTFLALCSVCFLLSFSGFLWSQWKYIPENAKVKFFVKEDKAYEEGVFSGIEGGVDFDPAAPEKASLTAVIKVATINTGIEMRDESLRSKDFFEVTKYPQIRFASTQITRTDSGYLATGKLTIKKTTKDIKIPFQFIQQDSTAVFKGRFTIDRTDYGVGSKGDGVGTEVRVELEVPVRKNQ
jgi:polyisoprenoid-binding protein YceI